MTEAAAVGTGIEIGARTQMTAAIIAETAIVLIDSLLFAFVMRNSPLMIVRQAAKLF